jgi:tRNA A37 threonylcarbamoyladenosine synthetase subunit TsaC/SUA5/YrdC
MLGEDVEIILDGGPVTGGLASTIVDVTGERPRVLRLGALSIESLDEALAESGVRIDEDGD